MKIAIYGAGAIGGLMGAYLARAGEEVTLIARGAHLAAMKQNGLVVQHGGDSFTVRPQATDDPASAGIQDFVIIALKAQSVPPLADKLAPMFGPDTAVVMAVNGVPWWYFHGVGGALEGRRLASVDPGDAQWRHIGPERIIGCVVYPAAEIVEPGILKHVEGDRFTLGEPTGEKSDRVTKFSRALIAAGLKAPVRTDIRTEMWVKLWGNVAFNPLTALTGATLDRLCTEPGTRAVAKAMMLEAEAVANALGVKMPVDIERRIDGAAAIGAHKTSMLQDFERGRPIELDAIVGAVAELGRLVSVPTPAIDMIYALTRQKAAVAGLV
ncbi:ketopantoate reductase [Dongia mobilis]|uniref:2-dehydropantoate 2-reductase n=1 Tax=Dongia mobilis TaxID=578943 RepID=A0A4R6WNS8_9PROT|nr:2-dehydropantoate 2-reductase [Dongia mobilis]TDQ80620.1 ketopantoate reductase [Dongia mobilis]